MERARLNSPRKNHFFVYFLVLILLILPVFLQQARATEVTLVWDANMIVNHENAYDTRD